ncbi:MAG TPA: Spy/CpxP family protein refolding chaperone [Steroidobacteraceae bacterium]|nr:Spy/CpxP family protein refolding chaperone [Steroidobacteraceae bacterium]
MPTLPRTLIAFALAAGLAGLPAHADPGASAGGPAAAPTAPHHWHGRPRHHHGGEFRHVLHQLDLTPAQQGKITTIFAQSHLDMKAFHADMHQNREALEATSPSDPGYPALIAKAKSNAAAWIQHESDVKKQVYAVLTPDQQARIPQIVAADRAAREAHMKAWRDGAPPQG